MFLFFLYSLPLLAQNNSLFDQGNAAYNQGNYEEAVSSYEQILENGETSAALYFNLANAHYKLNNIAPSIYYYEKARQLDPNDSDIRNNLTIAQNMVIDEIDEEQETGISRIWNNTVSILGFNGWAWATIIFSTLFAVLFLLYYFTSKSLLKRLYFSFSSVALVCMILSLVFAIQQNNTYSNNQYAIIFSQEAVVRGEPTPRAEEIFMLHEGTKVEVLESYQDWIKFELPNGVQGWMEKNDIKFF